MVIRLLLGVCVCVCLYVYLSICLLVSVDRSLSMSDGSLIILLGPHVMNYYTDFEDGKTGRYGMFANLPNIYLFFNRIFILCLFQYLYRRLKVNMDTRCLPHMSWLLFISGPPTLNS